MPFFDFENVFGFFTGKRETISTGLNGLSEVIQKEKENAVKGIVPAARNKAMETDALFQEVKQAVKELEAEEPEAYDARGMNIAVEMKKNFAARVPALLSIGQDVEELDYFELVEFHEKTAESVRTITKINFDNRYIFFFYRKSSEKLKEAMRKLAANSEELGKMLEEKKEAAKAFEEIEASERQLQKTTEEKKKVEERRKELEKQLKETEKDERLEREAELLERIRKAEEENAAENKGMEATEGRVASQFVLLERALRKFSRACDKKEEKAIQSLLENAFEFVKREEGKGAARALLGRLKASIEKRELEFGNEERILGAIDFVSGKEFDELLAQHEKKAAGRNVADGELASLKAKKAEIDDLKRKIRDLAKEIEKSRIRENEDEEKIEELKEKIENEFEKAAGKKITIEA